MLVGNPRRLCLLASFFQEILTRLPTSTPGGTVRPSIQRPMLATNYTMLSRSYNTKIPYIPMVPAFNSRYLAGALYCSNRILQTARRIQEKKPVEPHWVTAETDCRGRLGRCGDRCPQQPFPPFYLCPPKQSSCI